MANLRVSLYQALSALYTTYLTTPQDAALPFLRITRIDRRATYAMTGDVNNFRDHWQIDAYADSLLAADTMARAVQSTLSGFKGMLGVTDQTNVGSIFITNVRESKERRKDSEDEVHRVMVECIIECNE